jgi:hypothetical protein
MQIYKLLEIKYGRIRISGNRFDEEMTSDPIEVDVVRCQDYFFVSKNQWVHLGSDEIEVIQEWEQPPLGKVWSNKNRKSIVRRILLFRNLNDILNC